MANTESRLRQSKPMQNACKNPHHDRSLDGEVMIEFARRFPSLRFVSFYRNSTFSETNPGFASSGLHVIEFVGSPTELLTGGVATREMLPVGGRTYAISDGPGHWITRYDRRRKGMLTVRCWLWDDYWQGHVLSWLHPHHWHNSRRPARPNPAGLRLVWSNPGAAG